MIRTLAAIAFALVVAAPVAAVAQNAAPTAPAAEKAAPVINLNTASATELESLPGIGPKTAQRIVEYREKNGSFKKVEDLMNVKGIGEKSFLKLRSRLSVAPPAKH